MNNLDNNSTLVTVSNYGFHSDNKYSYLTAQSYNNGLVKYKTDENGDIVIYPIAGDIAIDFAKTKA